MSFLNFNPRQHLGIRLGDANQCQRVLAKLEAGTVWVNQYGVLYNNVRSISFQPRVLHETPLPDRR